MTTSIDRPLWVSALLDKHLSAVEYRVWSYLYWRQGGNGHAWPSQAMIAADLGLTAEGVRKITKRLQETGWVSVEWSKGPGRGKEHYKHYAVTSPEKTPTAIPLLPIENPNSGLGLTAENPNSHTTKTPTAKPRHKRRTLPGTLTSSAPARTITYDASTRRFSGVTDEDKSDWSVAYPSVDVEQELLRAAVWWTKNPGKRKKDIGRFLSNWMARAERGFPGRGVRPDPVQAEPEPAPVVRGADGRTPRERYLAQLEGR